MMSAERIDYFRGSTVLSPLDPSQIADLAAACRESFPEAGQLLAREGAPGDSISWVVDGEFEVFLTQPELGVERTIRLLKRGDHFGEVALLTDSPRTASVRARSRGHLLELDKEAFLECLRREHALLRAFLARLGRYLADATRDQARVPLVHLDSFPDWKKHRHVIPGKIAETCRALVLKREPGRVTIGMPDPYDHASRNFLVQVLHPAHADFVALTREDYARAISEAQRPIAAGERPDAGAAITVSGHDGTREPLGDQGADPQLRWILSAAHDAGATDIHLDPGDGAMTARLRIQGNMVTLDRTVPAADGPRVVSRLKVLAGLDITEHRRPQDGSFLVSFNGQNRCARLAVVPTHWGEKAALRLLPDEDDPMLVLETLVPSRPVAAGIRELIDHPGGLVLVCGPTGSGKTTLLYSGLRTILERNPVRNIIAIEEPVDRLLRGVTQIPINRRVGFGFADALRAVLRQDPDVILVGEIRDRETARVAVEAAATGHLVLSSVHASSAAEAFTRLRSLDVEPYLIRASLRGIIALRLVPRNCSACAEPVPSTDPILDRCAAAGIWDPNGDTPKRGRGCDACRDRGTLGRMALLEILVPDPQRMESLLAGRPLENPGPGWLPMTAYARYLAAQGWVSPENLLRTLPPNSEPDALKTMP